jgi:hypothetical protein
MLTACTDDSDDSETAVIKTRVMFDKFWESFRLGKYVNTASQQQYFYEFKENGDFIYGSNINTFYSSTYRMIDLYNLEFYIPTVGAYSNGESFFDSTFATFYTDGLVFEKE